VLIRERDQIRRDDTDGTGGGAERSAIDHDTTHIARPPQGHTQNSSA
jgi:hypothetical protein